MKELLTRASGIVLLSMLMLQGVASAQLNFSVSPTPVGSGARAAGMSDAFVAIADDATAASWNPAGLIQLEEPEFSFVHAYNRLSEDLSSRENPGFDRDFNDTFSGSSDATNFASVVYPSYIWGRNVSFSLAYRNGYDFGRSYDLNANNPGRLLRAEFDQSGSLSTITPAFAISLTNTLSVGVSLNLWRSNFISDNDWEIDQRQVARVFENGTLRARQDVTQSESFENFTGENYVFGVLWNATEKWNIGLRYDSAFTGDVDYSRQTDLLLQVFGGGAPTEIRDSASVKEEWKVKFPWTLAIGTSYRFTDRFTLSADVSVSDWGESYVKDDSGARLSIIDGLPESDPAYTHAKRNIVARLGAEYVFIPRDLNENLDYLWSLRGGLVYEEEPATGKPTGLAGTQRPGDGKPESFYGASVGVGLLVKQRFNFDIAYQFRYGDSVNKDFVSGPNGFSEDTRQHRIIMSTVVYF